MDGGTDEIHFGLGPPCTLHLLRCVVLLCVTSSWLKIFDPTERPGVGVGNNVIESVSPASSPLSPLTPRRAHVKSVVLAAVLLC